MESKHPLKPRKRPHQQHPRTTNVTETESEQARQLLLTMKNWTQRLLSTTILIRKAKRRKQGKTRLASERRCLTSTSHLRPDAHLIPALQNTNLQSGASAATTSTSLLTLKFLPCLKSHYKNLMTRSTISMLQKLMSKSKFFRVSSRV